jgi:hypothetical protein
MSRPALSVGAGHRTQSLVVSVLAGAALTTFPPSNRQKLRMPQTGKVVGITLNVGAKGGTHSVSTLDVQVGGTSLLVALFDVAGLTAGTPVDKEGAALAAAAAIVAKDGEIDLIWAQSGGSSPTFQDATVQIDYIPLGD